MTTQTPQAKISSVAQLSGLLGIEFSDEQAAAITAPLAPGVIIAGAGTGKTTVMAARVVWLVGTGQVAPEQVLGLTFTRKAAHELGLRVDSALAAAGRHPAANGDDTDTATVLTYDSFAGRLLSDHGLRIGAEADQRLITGAVRHRLAGQVVARWQGELPSLGAYQPATLVERVLKLDGELQAHLVDPAEVVVQDAAFAHELATVKQTGKGPTAPVRTAQEAIDARRELIELVGRYRDLKAEHGFVEFADQMMLAARLVAASPEVAAQLRTRYRVVLLDEYQDTSAAQAVLLRGLFSGPDAAAGRGHAVTAVGDPFQAIYGWRGAAPSNILQFTGDFPNADGSPAAQYALTVNRRSRPLILDAANRISRPLRGDGRLRDAPDSTGPDARLLRAPDGVTGGDLEVAGFDTWPQEVQWVADQVAAIGSGAGVQRWSDIAVLTRQNAPISVAFSELVARGVPVEIVGLGGLLQVPEVADVVSTLRLIDDVSSNPDVLRLLAGPRWRIGPRDLAVLGRRASQLARGARPDQPMPDDPLVAAVADTDTAEQLCLLDAVADPGAAPLSAAARERIAEFDAELRRLRAHREEPPLELVGRVIETLGIGLELDSDPDWFAAQRSRQLARFVDAVAGYVDIDGDGSLSGMLAWLQAELEQAEGLDQATPSADDSVKLLTVHRAKGLEWEVVFLPSLCDGVFPSGQAPDNWTRQGHVLPSELRGDHEWVPQLGEPSTKRLRDEYPAELRAAQRQAEDRLAYVAVTRARRHLVATTHHWFPGRVTVRRGSPYFEDLSALAAEVGAPVTLAPASEENPLLHDEVSLPWPEPEDLRRQEALSRAAGLFASVVRGEADDAVSPSLDELERRSEWHRLALGLVEEARNRRRAHAVVALPASMSASALLTASRNIVEFSHQLLRPMPRPAGRQASIGTRFHQWLEGHFGTSALFDELDRADEDDMLDESSADRQVARLVAAFERGAYADRVPLFIEEPFIASVAGHQVRGRIDAVFLAADDPDHDYQVVDWKTSNRPADPLQLSLYRYAWAHSTGTPLDRVDAVFYHVLADEIERPPLLDEDGLAALIGGLASDWAGTPAG